MTKNHRQYTWQRRKKGSDEDDNHFVEHDIKGVTSKMRKEMALTTPSAVRLKSFLSAVRHKRLMLAREQDYLTHVEAFPWLGDQELVSAKLQSVGMLTKHHLALSFN